MSGKVAEVGDQNFEAEVLNSSVPVLVDFWAAWCAPCRMLSPVVEEIAEKYEGQAKVFKLNVDEQPESWNVYDSLAEGYERSGDIRNAIKYYERSLEINPANSHGKERLKNLRSKYLTV